MHSLWKALWWDGKKQVDVEPNQDRAIVYSGIASASSSIASEMVSITPERKPVHAAMAVLDRQLGHGKKDLWDIQLQSDLE